MAGQNIHTVFTNNPITNNATTDLMYFGQSPYTTGDDAAMTLGNFAGQFQRNKFTYAVDTGTADNYAVAFTPPFAAYTDGMSFWFQPQNNNLTNTPVINVDGLGNQPLVGPGGSTLALSDLFATYNYLCVYDGANSEFIVVNPQQAGDVILNTIGYNGHDYLVDSGSANAYSVTTNVYPNLNITGAVGVRFYMQPANTNTGASTLTFNGVTLPILYNYNALTAGMIQAYNGSNPYLLVLDGGFGAWLLLNPFTNPHLSSNIPFASATSISSGSSTTLTSLVLPAGNWLVNGNIYFNPSGTNVEVAAAGINTTTNTLPNNSLFSQTATNTTANMGATGLTAPSQIISGGQTVYLIGFISLASGTCTQCGNLTAIKI